MRWTRWAMSLAVAAILAATTHTLLASAQSAKAAKKPAGARQKQIERGEYLTTIAGCNDCHTPGTLYGAPDFERRLAGSDVGWQGPWGVSYARNLTPHLETGIGRWSEDQIYTALRTGVHPLDGHVLLPPMPWPNTAVMTEEDLRAIVAFLKSLPAVDHRVPANRAPGDTVSGALVAFPPPPAWDAPRVPADTSGNR